jgi:hypothetical protein
MQSGKTADDLEMTELFGSDIHQQVLTIRIFAIEALDGILHGGSEFAVGAAELLKQHVAKSRIGLVNADGEHEFFNVMIHGQTSCVGLAGQPD